MCRFVCVNSSDTFVSPALLCTVVSQAFGTTTALKCDCTLVHFGQLSWPDLVTDNSIPVGPGKVEVGLGLVGELQRANSEPSALRKPLCYEFNVSLPLHVRNSFGVPPNVPRAAPHAVACLREDV